jgi:hypothetical protein
MADIIIVAPHELHELVANNQAIAPFLIPRPGRLYANDERGIAREEFYFIAEVNGVPLNRNILDQLVVDARVIAANRALAANLGAPLPPLPNENEDEENNNNA